MKKLILDFGIEKVSILKVDIKGKGIKVLDCFSLDSSKYYNDSGAIDIKALSNDIKEKVGKDATSLDMDIVLPDYMTKTEYRETERVEGLKPDEIKEPYNSKLNDKLIAFLGDNGKDSTTQIVFYNKQVLKSFLKEMYKAGLNVVNAISSYTAYQNTIPVFQSISAEYGGYTSNTSLMVMIGTHNVNCVVFNNNLPVYMKECDISLYELFQTLKAQDGYTRFASLMEEYKEASPASILAYKKANVAYVSAESNTVEAKAEREMEEMMADAFDSSMYSDEPVNKPEETASQRRQNHFISSEVSLIMNKVCQNIREVADYVSDQYGAATLEVCCNSTVGIRYIEDQLSSIYKINSKQDMPSEINVGDIEIDLSNTNGLKVEFIGCLGEIISGIKKGADFYA